VKARAGIHEPDTRIEKTRRTQPTAAPCPFYRVGWRPRGRHPTAYIFSFFEI